MGFTLAKDSACSFGYVLTPKQFSPGDSIKNGLINLIQFLSYLYLAGRSIGLLAK